MNEYNRKVLELLQAILALYSDGLRTSIEDLQQRVATTGGLLERGVDDVSRTLQNADGQLGSLIFAPGSTSKPSSFATWRGSCTQDRLRFER